MASTAGNSEEEDDFVNPHFDQQRPDLEYYEHPPMPAVLNGTLVALRITYDGVCVSRKGGPKERRERTLALREMRSWKATTEVRAIVILPLYYILIGLAVLLLDFLISSRTCRGSASRSGTKPSCSSWVHRIDLFI